MAAATIVASLAKGPSLLPDEKEVAVLEQVTELGPNWTLADGGGSEEGPVGTLYATSQRFCFMYKNPIFAPNQRPAEEIDIPYSIILKIDKSPSKSKSMEVRRILCKDFRVETFALPNAQSKELSKIIKRFSSFTPTSIKDKELVPFESFDSEMQRMGAPLSVFRQSELNTQFQFCESLPRKLLVPKTLPDSHLEAISRFRAKARIPLLTYFHKATSTGIIRGASPNPVVSQDMVGMAQISCSEDSDMLHILRANISKSGKLAIIDLKMLEKDASTSWTLNDPDVIFEFIGLPDAPRLAAMYSKLHTLITTPPTQLLLSDKVKCSKEVESIKWMSTVAQVFNAVQRVVSFTREGIASLLQNPTGDDIVAIVSTLAQLCLDQTLRETRGFCSLLEKEFAFFGRLAGSKREFQRNRTGADDATCAVCFLLFDCVWQLWQNFPSSFEFNESLLLFLADAAISSRYGGSFMFLANEKDRSSESQKCSSSILWNYVLNGSSSSRFTNGSYKKNPHSLQMKEPESRVKFWTQFYLRYANRENVRKARAHLSNKLTDKNASKNTVQLNDLFLPQVPEELSHLTQLVSLDLSNNALVTACLSSPEVLRPLKQLNLDRNRLGQLSIDAQAVLFGALERAETFSIAANGISQLSKDCEFRSTVLRVLKLGDNALTSLPQSFKALTALEELYLNGNSLTELPAEISHLHNLELLDVNSNRLTTVPDAILVRLTRLRTLNMGQNPLSRLPLMSPLAKTLTSLNLENATGTSAFQDLLSLTKLQHLAVGNLQLKELPSEIGRFFTLLQSLSLRANSLAAFPVENLRSLGATLEHLDLSDNQLSQISFEICQLSKLRSLNLSNNRLTELTSGVARLSALTSLNLAFNPDLKELPASLSLLKLTYLNLEGLHKITQPPLRVVQASSASNPSPVLLYLSALLQGSVNLYRFKLMLVGQENVGKTSLLRCILRRLAKNKKSYDIATISTDGIFIEPWIFPVPTTPKQNIEVSLWDFAGQEIYYSTHQFFLSERSLYVLVWNIAKPEGESRVEYWLQSIAARAKDAPVLLVGTHIDEPVCTKEYLRDTVAAMEKKYLRRFPNIKQIATVSCASGKNIDKLRSDIEKLISDDPRVGDAIPTTYEQFEKLLLAERKKRMPPTLTFAELVAVGQLCKLKDTESVRLAATLMHDLGSIVYFDHDPNLQDLVILDPQWLVDVMASVLTTKHVYGKDGKLKHSALAQIWREPRFPQSLHPTLLYLLEKFEVAFRINNNPKDSQAEPIHLIPFLLDANRPADFEKHWPTQPAPKQRQYGRVYRFDFVPKGFFSRVVVRLLFRFASLRCLWQNGVVISKSASASNSNTETILMEYAPAKRTVDITIRTSSVITYESDSTAKQIVDAFESLLHDWYKIAVHVSAPCVHCIDSNRQPVFLFPIELCSKAALQGRAFVYCEGDQSRPVRIDTLVPDIAMSVVSQKKLDFNAVKILEKLGEGSFATVHRGVLNGEAVAVKVLKMPQPGSNQSKEESRDLLAAFYEFRREVSIMSGLNHPNLVSLRGFMLEPQCCIVLELLADGTLMKFLHDESRPLRWQSKISIGLDIARGMAYLHNSSPPIIHRDLKSPNVLLQVRSPDDVVAKVSDFGTSQALALQTTKGRAVQNPVWLAPEIMRKQEYNEKVDNYAFGVVLWEICTRRYFLDADNSRWMSQIEDAILSGERPHVPSLVPADVSLMIRSSWGEDVDARPSFSDMVPRLEAVLEAVKRSPPAELDFPHPSNPLSGGVPPVVAAAASAVVAAATVGGRSGSFGLAGTPGSGSGTPTGTSALSAALQQQHQQLRGSGILILSSSGNSSPVMPSPLSSPLTSAASKQQPLAPPAALVAVSPGATSTSSATMSTSAGSSSGISPTNGSPTTSSGSQPTSVSPQFSRHHSGTATFVTAMPSSRSATPPGSQRSTTIAQPVPTASSIGLVGATAIPVGGSPRSPLGLSADTALFPGTSPSSPSPPNQAMVSKASPPDRIARPASSTQENSLLTAALTNAAAAASASLPFAASCATPIPVSGRESPKIGNRAPSGSMIERLSSGSPSSSPILSPVALPASASSSSTSLNPSKLSMSSGNIHRDSMLIATREKDLSLSGSQSPQSVALLGSAPPVSPKVASSPIQSRNQSEAPSPLSSPPPLHGVTASISSSALNSRSGTPAAGDISLSGSTTPTTKSSSMKNFSLSSTPTDSPETSRKNKTPSNVGSSKGTGTAGAFLGRLKTALPAVAQSMCQVENRMWIGLVDGRLILYDIQGDKALEAKTAFSSSVTSILFIPSSNAVWSAAADENLVRIWDSKSAKLVTELKPFACRHLIRVEKFVWGCKGSIVTIVDPSNLQVQKTIDAEFGPITSGAYSSPSGRVFIGAGKYVLMFSADRFSISGYLQGHTADINDVQASKDEIFTASQDGTIRVWSAQNGIAIRKLEAHRASVNCLLPLPASDYLWSASSDRSVLLWSISSGFVEKEHRNVEQPMTVLRSIENLSAAESQKIWAACADSVIYLYSKQ